MTAPATVPLTWNSFFQQIATMAVVQTTTTNGVIVGVDADTNTTMPQACQYAELRIQRDLDLLPARTSRAYTLTSGSNQLTLSSNDFIAVETITVNNGANTTPLLATTLEWLQDVYGDSVPGTPAYFAMYGGDLATGGNTSSYIQFAPGAAGAYPVTLTGMVRLPSLYSFATPTEAGLGTTWISTYLPDMLIQAAMIYISQYQRNFGPTEGNNGDMPGSYEAQYGLLLAGAKAENARARWEASGWSSKSQPTIATPTR